MDLAYTTINLEAIAHNTRVLKDIALQRGAQLMCVVKADGYNHGFADVARVMAASGADQFGVATLAEAHALRESGIDQPVLAWLWDPESADIAAAVAAGIDVAVSSVAHARAVVGLGARVTVKVDTGLNRSGVDEPQWREVFGLLGGENVTGLMTHFACADGTDEASRASVQDQIDVLHRAIAVARECGLEVPVNHAANSPASLNIPEATFDMLRPGLALYGLEPIPGEDHGLIPAMTWAGRTTVVKPVKAGEGVSYSHTWRAPEDGFTAVVPVGYADGLPRAAQSHLQVTIGGHRYPQVGRVCMDQIVVWLGSNPHNVAAGDEAILFGPGMFGEMTATELAESMGTINYELVCRPTGRTVRRVVRRFVCDTVEQTHAVAEHIGGQLVRGEVVLLSGPLGAGKTTFTQGLARGLGVRGRVTSPTFVLAREHRPTGDGPGLVHVDAYRLLEGAGQVDLLAELDSLDLDSELEDSVVVAEWGDGLVERLSGRVVRVSIDRTTAHALDEQSEARIITVEGLG